MKRGWIIGLIVLGLILIGLIVFSFFYFSIPPSDPQKDLEDSSLVVHSYYNALQMQNFDDALNYIHQNLLQMLSNDGVKSTWISQNNTLGPILNYAILDYKREYSISDNKPTYVSFFNVQVNRTRYNSMEILQLKRNSGDKKFSIFNYYVGSDYYDNKKK